MCHYIILSIVLMQAFSLEGLLPWVIPVSGPAFTIPHSVVLLIASSVLRYFWPQPRRTQSLLVRSISH